MNKKGEEESSGIGTVTSIVLIIAVLIVLILFIPGTAFTQVKKSLTNIIGEKGELGKLYNEVVNREKLDEQGEQNAADEIHSFFAEKFNSIKDKDDCVIELDFGKIKDKNFEVEFSTADKATSIRAVSGEREDYKRVYLNVYNYPICFLNQNKVDNFWLVEKFSKIYDGDEHELILTGANSKPILYKSSGEICFVGEQMLGEINIYKKDSCELSSKISELEKIESDDKNFISKKVELMGLYLRDKKFWKVLDYYIFLDKPHINIDDVQRERIRVYREQTINELEDNEGRWILCRINNKHVCVTSEIICDAENIAPLVFPKLPQKFNFLRDCENARFDRVDVTEAASYITQ